MPAQQKALDVGRHSNFPIMHYTFRIILVFLFYCTSCESESEKTLKKFKEVNNSLKRLNTDTTFKSVYNRIAERRNVNLSLFLSADSTRTKLEIANNVVDSIIMTIVAIDTTGEKTDVGSTILIGTEIGADLIDKTYAVYRYATDNSAYQSSRDKIKSFFTKYRGLFGNKEFLQLMNKTPSLAVVTILRGVKVDCIKAATICLRDIEVRLDE